MRLFWRHGYEGVSVADLTSAIGIAPPSLYSAFGSKAGLYREALDRYEAGPGLLDMDRVAASGELAGAVRALLEGAIRSVTHPERERGCMVSSGLVMCHPDQGLIADDVAARRAALQARIAMALQPFSSEEETPRLARHMAAVMQGLSVQAIDGATTEDLQQVVEDVVAGVAARDGQRAGSGAKPSEPPGATAKRA